MKIRTFFLTLVINIFLMYLVTILFEYVNLSERFTSLEQTVSTVVETSVDSSFGAEELFSSTTDSNELSNTDTNNFLLVLDTDGRLYNVNIYAYSYYFNNYILGQSPYYNGYGKLVKLDPSSSVLSNLASTKVDTAFAFNYLYGQVGSVWGTSASDSTLDWTKTTSTVKNNYRNVLNSKLKQNYGISVTGGLTTSGTASSNTSRVPTPEFKAFYDAVGSKVTSIVPVRQKNSSGGFTIVDKEIPLLTNMGLSLNSYNNIGSNITMQNYLSTVKVGKKEVAGAVSYSTYYLTPYSLGVTYIPTKVLYPTILNNLNTTVALNKVAQGKSDSLNKHYGCMDAGKYGHIISGSTDGLIINDGQVEYDLSSLNVAVDYVAIDFADWKTNATKQEIIHRIEGGVASVTHSGFSTSSKGWSQSQKYYNSALSILGSSYGTIASKTSVRVIARITAQIKVHIPYQCDLLRYNCLKYTGGINSEHYDIKDYNSSTGKYKADSTGLWYEYTTYRCHAQ